MSACINNRGSIVVFDNENNCEELPYRASAIINVSTRYSPNLIYLDQDNNLIRKDGLLVPSKILLRCRMSVSKIFYEDQYIVVLYVDGSCDVSYRNYTETFTETLIKDIQDIVVRLDFDGVDIRAINRNGDILNILTSVQGKWDDHSQHFVDNITFDTQMKICEFPGSPIKIDVNYIVDDKGCLWKKHSQLDSFESSVLFTPISEDQYSILNYSLDSKIIDFISHVECKLLALVLVESGKLYILRYDKYIKEDVAPISEIIYEGAHIVGMVKDSSGVLFLNREGELLRGTVTHNTCVLYKTPIKDVLMLRSSFNQKRFNTTKKAN